MATMFTGQFESQMLGQEFIVIQESGHSHDRHAVAVYCHNKDPGVIVGDIPWEISKTCHYFTTHEGKIIGEVTACCIHNEEAGGMEIPQCQIFERNTVP